MFKTTFEFSENAYFKNFEKKKKKKNNQKTTKKKKKKKKNKKKKNSKFPKIQNLC